MCKNQNKDSIQLYGFILTIIYFIFLIVNIFLAGFDFKESHQNWAEGPYKVIGILQLIVVCVGFIIVILGFLSFKIFKDNTGINAIVRKKNIKKFLYNKIIYFSILILLSSLFTMSVCILILVGSTIGRIKNYIGCNTQFKGLLKYWRSIDAYIIEADKKLCSSDCICKLNEFSEKMFQNDPIAYTIYSNFWYKSNNESDINAYEKIQDCNNIDLQSIYDNEYKSYYDMKINGDKFNTFWKNVEERFDCAGFCITNYQSDYDIIENADSDSRNYPNQIPMIKYTFSGINKGPVKHKGCFRLLVNWMIDSLISFGILGLIASVIQFCIFIISVQLLCNCFEGNGEDIRDSNDNNEGGE